MFSIFISFLYFVILFVAIIVIIFSVSVIISAVATVILLPLGMVDKFFTRNRNKVLPAIKNIILGLFVIALGFYVFLNSPLKEAVIIQICCIIIAAAGIFLAGASIREITILLKKTKIEESKK